jgi:hypothetical protein
MKATLWNKPELGPVSMDGRMLLAPTQKQRGTRAIYWAVLWNRCLAIIDDHSHWESNPMSTTQTPNEGSHHGKRLLWGGQNANVIENAANIPPSGVTAWVSSIYVDADLDMHNSPYEEMAVEGAPGWAMKSLYHAGLGMEANPVDESRTLFFSDEHSDTEFGFPADMTSPNISRRYSLFTRMRVNPIDTTQIGTDDVISNYNYAPSISLVWNTGMNNGIACEIINNVPGGAVLGAWKFYAFDHYSWENWDPSTNWRGTFQNPTEESHDYNSIPVGGYYYKNTNRPFLGMLDDGSNGFGGWDLSGTSDNTYAAFPEYWTSSSHIRWDNSTYTTTAILTLLDTSGMQDPKLEIPRPLSRDMQNVFFYSPYKNEMSWFANNNHAYRCGTIVVVSDIKGNASTYNIVTTLANLISPTDDIPMVIRWFESGVPKTYSYTQAGGSTGDLLTLDQDYGSIVLVKGPFLWQTNAGGSVDEGQYTGGDMCWFAYFVD